MFRLMDEHGGAPVGLALLGMFVHVSVIVSCALLLLERRAGLYLALGQAPFRMMFMIPSVSLLLLYAQLAPAHNGLLMAGLVMLSEILKGWSCWWVLRRPSVVSLHGRK